MSQPYSPYTNAPPGYPPGPSYSPDGRGYPQVPHQLKYEKDYQEYAQPGHPEYVTGYAQQAPPAYGGHTPVQGRGTFAPILPQRAQGAPISPVSPISTQRPTTISTSMAPDVVSTSATSPTSPKSESKKAGTKETVKRNNARDFNAVMFVLMGDLPLSLIYCLVSIISAAMSLITFVMPPLGMLTIYSSSLTWRVMGRLHITLLSLLTLHDLPRPFATLRPTVSDNGPLALSNYPPLLSDMHTWGSLLYFSLIALPTAIATTVICWVVAIVLAIFTWWIGWPAMAKVAAAVVGWQVKVTQALIVGKAGRRVSGRKNREGEGQGA